MSDGGPWRPGDRLLALLPDPAPALHPVLWGDLGELNATELFSLLEQQRSTGLLSVSCDGVERAMALVAGSLRWARSERAEENTAAALVVWGLLAGGPGTFTFLRAPAGALPAGPALDLRPLLLEGLRRIDEARRARRREP